MAGNHGPGRRRGPGLAPGERLSKGIVKRVVKDIFSFFVSTKRDIIWNV